VHGRGSFLRRNLAVLYAGLNRHDEAERGARTGDAARS
jgi:hypothetical protein